MAVRNVLLITETSDLAADLLILAARERSIPIVRFNQDDFQQRARVQWRGIGCARFLFADCSFAEDEVSGVWFRKFPRIFPNQDQAFNFVLRETEGFLKGVFETAPWAWMNLPSAIARAELKLLQLRNAQHLGLRIPDTLVTNCPEAARSFAHDRNIIAKTVVGSGLMIDGIDQGIFTTAIQADDLRSDSAIHACPIIFQNRVQTQFDLRVTVVGTEVFAARIFVRDRTQTDLDWREVDSTRLRYERESLPPNIKANCIKLVESLGLIYGALDFVVTPEGEHFFLELNPSGQWGWIERELHMPITDTILDHLVEPSYG